jgi:hypothetical protein
MMDLGTVYRILENFFWGISVILCGSLVCALAYQLTVLYVPYWTGNRNFPDYFYRVYGDDVSSLAFEHYGYLISGLVVAGVCCAHLVRNPPWREKSD